MGSNFEKRFPEGVRKLDSCRGKKPPRPERLRLVDQWPFFGMEDDIMSDFYNECGDRFSYRPKGLLLYGASGTGKTVAAWLTIKRTFSEWDSNCSAPDIDFWRAAALGRAITEAARGEEGEIERLLSRLSRCGILFVDDLDKARFTPRVQAELFDLIEMRDNLQLPMIVTTNASGAELALKFEKTIGPPVVNRLLRLCHEIDFDDSGFNYDESLLEIQEDIRGRVSVQLDIVRERMERIRQRAAQAEIERQDRMAQAEAEMQQIMTALADGNESSLPDALKRRVTLRMRFDASNLRMKQEAQEMHEPHEAPNGQRQPQ